MPFRSVQKIEAKRTQALRGRLLQTSATDFVKAEWQWDGQTFPVKMRLKGDWIDHLWGRKWSYRVKMRGSHAFLGMRRFSIQDPTTRNFLLEWAYLEHLRHEGVAGAALRVHESDIQRR